MGILAWRYCKGALTLLWPPAPINHIGGKCFYLLQWKLSPHAYSRHRQLHPDWDHHGRGGVVQFSPPIAGCQSRLAPHSCSCYLCEWHLNFVWPFTLAIQEPAFERDPVRIHVETWNWNVLSLEQVCEQKPRSEHILFSDLAPALCS